MEPIDNSEREELDLVRRAVEKCRQHRSTTFLVKLVPVLKTDLAQLACHVHLGNFGNDDAFEYLRNRLDFMDSEIGHRTDKQPSIKLVAVVFALANLKHERAIAIAIEFLGSKDEVIGNMVMGCAKNCARFAHADTPESLFRILSERY